MSIAAKVTFTRWGKGYGGELNWLGRGLVKTLGKFSVGQARSVNPEKTSKIALPEMIVINNKLSIMKNEVTVALFKQVMEGYEITGHNAEKLTAILNDESKASDPLTYVSLFDAREFAEWLSDKTGRAFRVQTEKEFLKAQDKLSGNYWTWTETEYEDYKGTFVLRHLVNGSRYSAYPGTRYYDRAARLVEYLNCRSPHL